MLTRCEAKTMVLLDLATFTSQLSYNRRNLFKLTVYRVKKAFCNCLERGRPMSAYRRPTGRLLHH